MKQKHAVKTYTLSGHGVYFNYFYSAEEAHKEYTEIVENLKEHLPIGYGITVIRFRDNQIMAEETIIGRATR